MISTPPPATSPQPLCSNLPTSSPSNSKKRSASAAKSFASMHLVPDTALILFTLGVLLIYLELNRPGLILPGAVVSDAELADFIFLEDMVVRFDAQKEMRL